MADTEQPVLLKDVVDRFEESRGTLDDLAGKLRDLTLIEEAQRDDHASLKGAADAVAAAAEHLQSVVEVVHEAVDATQQVTEAASAVLNASDARALHDRLDQIASEIAKAVADGLESQRSQQEDLRAKLTDLETSVTARLDDVAHRLERSESAALQRERELQEQLDRVRGGLSPRHLRKVGLAD